MIHAAKITFFQVTAIYSEKILGGKWLKKRVTAEYYRQNISISSELEINKRLQISSDELVDDKHDEGANHYH